VVDKRKAERNRATIKSIGGQAFDPDKMYRVAVSDYLAEGNSGYDRLTTIGEEHRINTGIMMREALRDYIIEFGADAKIDSRWTILK